MCECEGKSGISKRELLCGVGAVVGTAALAAYPDMAFASAYIENKYQIGDKTVGIRIYNGHDASHLYFAPHSSETTCVQAALSVTKTHGGKLVQIINGGQRNITFRVKGMQYAVDPNRIFTDVGLAASIKKLSSAYSKDAHDAVAGFVKYLLINIGGMGGKTLIGLHNNTPGSYSILSYKPGGEYARDVSDLSINSSLSPDDFYFTTARSIFDALKKSYNVALQDAKRVINDGSMSVYCAQHGVRYVNVEAQAGHLTVQSEMLRALKGG